MRRVRYDKSFDGLLTVVFEAFSRRRFPDRLSGPEEVSLLDACQSESIETDKSKATRVFTALRQRLGKAALEDLLLAWQSEAEGADTLLFRLICTLFRQGGGQSDNYRNRETLAVHQLAKKVYGEYHSLLGFARFQQTREGVYFCAIQPRFNVLPLMTPHFVDRFADQAWILFDAARHYGVHYNPVTGALLDLSLDPGALTATGLNPELLTEEERSLRGLWQGYCAAVAIPERCNPKLQARFLPRKYWHYLTERQNLLQG